MIKLTRVDHRLLHGQIAFSWVKFLDCDCILLVSDNLVKDEIKMQAMRMAKPTGIKLVMKSVEDSIVALNSNATDKYKLLIITENIETAYKLIEATSCIKTLNIGGTRKDDSNTQIAKAVFINNTEKELINNLLKNDVEVNVQLVPGESKKNIIDLI